MIEIPGYDEIARVAHEANDAEIGGQAPEIDRKAASRDEPMAAKIGVELGLEALVVPVAWRARPQSIVKRVHHADVVHRETFVQRAVDARHRPFRAPGRPLSRVQL